MFHKQKIKDSGCQHFFIKKYFKLNRNGFGDANKKTVYSCVRCGLERTEDKKYPDTRIIPDGGKIFEE